MTRVPVEAVLCDRDGTLIVDVPYNGDPTRVEPMATVAGALARLRAAGVPVAVVSNQSGIARGDFTDDDLERVMERVDDLLGPFEAIVWCPHGPDDGCPCRKPAPGMVHDAARRLGVAPERCAVIGDTEADVEAARVQLRQVEELAALDARSALAELIAARAAWEATAGTVQQANRAYEIAEVRYEAGVSTQLELSDSRLLLQQAEANRAQAGRDPAGISTQEDELAARFDPVLGGRRIANYLRVLTLETQTLARACGKSHVHNL